MARATNRAQELKLRRYMQGLVRSGDFRKGTPITLPHVFGNPVGEPEPFGNNEPQSNSSMSGNLVTWLPSPAHFGNQVSFSLQTVPPVVIAAPGSTVTTDINLTNLLGTSSAELSYFGAPVGVTVAFAPNPDTTTSIATVTVGAAVLAGRYTITVFGTVASPDIEYTYIHLVVASSGTPPPPPTGIALVAHASAVAASFEPDPIITAPVSTVGANFLLAYVTSYENTTSFPLVVSDTIGGNPSGNTWVPLTNPNAGHVGQLFYVANANVGASHVFQASNAPGSFGLSIFVQAFSGLAASPFEAGSDQVILGPSGPPYNMTLTPAATGDLVIYAIAAAGNGISYAVSAGFTITDSGNDPTSGAGDGGALSYLIAPSATAVTPGWTTGGTGVVGSINGAVFAHA
jgi:hypothetical protein